MYNLWKSKTQSCTTLRHDFWGWKQWWLRAVVTSHAVVDICYFAYYSWSQIYVYETGDKCVKNLVTLSSFKPPALALCMLIAVWYWQHLEEMGRHNENIHPIWSASLNIKIYRYKIPPEYISNIKCVDNCISWWATKNYILGQPTYDIHVIMRFSFK